MNKEIKRIIEELESCIGMFDYLITPEDNDLLVLYIKELQEENRILKQSDKNTYESSQDMLSELSKENKELHNKIDKYKDLEQRLTFIKNRVKQGMTQENVNKCAIQLVNSYLKDSDVDE